MARLESTKRAKLKSAKQHQPSQKSKSLTCCYLLPRFWVTPYLVPIGTVDLKKKTFPSKSYSFLFQIKAVAQMVAYRWFTTVESVKHHLKQTKVGHSQNSKLVMEWFNGRVSSIGLFLSIHTTKQEFQENTAHSMTSLSSLVTYLST